MLISSIRITDSWTWIWLRWACFCSFRFFSMFSLLKLNLGADSVDISNVRTLEYFSPCDTRPCGTINLLVSIGEGKNKRIVKICLLIILCRNIYNGILKRSFVRALNATTSNYSKSKILVDDESSCDMIYFIIFIGLWLHMKDLKLYKG